MSALPPRFQAWFEARGWQPHPHQIALLQAKGDSLLIAPTGGGKTLAGFLPTLIELADSDFKGLHTIYVSPLKALTADIARNLASPIEEIGLSIRVEDRTGDTPASKRSRQRVDPPQILLTTPESLALMLSWPQAAKIFAGLRRVLLDELHTMEESRRGDLLMLGLARLRSLSPGLQVTGLSATVDDPERLAAYMGGAEVLRAGGGLAPDLGLLPTTAPPPWAGAGGRYAAADVIRAVSEAKSTLIFHHSRAQAELFFQALWLANAEGLPIALHHGSLSREARGKVEAAMAAGALRAVVATSSLDLGIDWGDVDLVIQVGSPRKIRQLVQRIGRSNHRYDSPSKARLLPVNRFDVIECLAAIEAVRSGDLDGPEHHPGAPEVLCQHILNTACAGPFSADALFAEVRSAGPYAALSRAEFDDCLQFAATGGYALKAYDRWQRLMERDGLWRLRDPRAARVIRMNIGTIVQREMVRVRRRGGGEGGLIGEIEERFAATLRPGDSFLLGGQVLRVDRFKELTLEVTPRPKGEPKIPAFNGDAPGASPELSARVARLVRAGGAGLPDPVQDWLALQAERSRLPREGRLLCEIFPHQGDHNLALYPFAGKRAHQTLGLILSHRMELAGLAPLGFIATDHALLIRSALPVTDPDALFDPEAAAEGFEDWRAGTSLLKRVFRDVATVAGLLHRQLPGARKTGRQASFSSDIIFEVLRRHEPDHLLLRATEAELRHSLLDLDRLGDLAQSLPQLDPVFTDRVTPLAAPLLLEMGRVRLAGAGQERAAARMAQALMDQSGLSSLREPEPAPLNPGGGAQGPGIAG